MLVLAPEQEMFCNSTSVALSRASVCSTAGFNRPRDNHRHSHHFSSVVVTERVASVQLSSSSGASVVCN